MDKPAGPTSHDVVAQVRRRLGTRAVGHTGTLDPFATGLLVVLVGKATRLARFVERQAKTYLATARLGVRTSTDDLTGVVVGPAVGRTAEPPSRRAAVAALEGFLGRRKQRPPTFSAKRVAGQRSHARARRGEAVELAECDVEVFSVELIGYDYPDLTFRAVVSAGTYLRALARDLGERLGTGAHLTELRREAIGAIRVDRAIALETVTAEVLLPPLAVLGHLPRVEVTEDEATALGYGKTIRCRSAEAIEEAEMVTATAGERLIAVARREAGGLHPEVVVEARG